VNSTVIVEALVGVDRAGSRDKAGRVIGVEGTCGIDNAVAAVCAVAVRT